MMKRLTLLITVLVCLATSVWAANSSMLDISVDHGVPLTLKSAATSVFIANPDIADVQVMSPTSVIIFGKRTGETTFMATDSNGNTLAQRTINVIQDLSNLRQELDAAIPGNKIQAKSLPNGIVLTGEAKDSATIADAYKLAQRYLPTQGGDIINRVHVVGSNQIMIRVRFAEVQRNIDNTLGIDWNSLASFGGFTFGLATGAATTAATSTASTLAAGLSRPPNATLAEPNDVLGLSRVGGRTSINNLIDALAEDGLITILAEPTLTAMSGETASFLAGGEIPYVVPQSGAGSAVTYSVTFKPYGISLAFTPTLISEDRINLHVKPEVSELSTAGAVTISGTSVPSLLTRRAETTVEVASGQSFAIAGLLDNDQRQTIDKYPMLGDIPVLGNLFRSNTFQSGQTELIVIITPYVVRPTNATLGLPTDGFSAPSDADRFINQRYSSSDPNARQVSGSPVATTAPVPSPPVTIPSSALTAPVAAPLAPVDVVPSQYNFNTIAPSSLPHPTTSSQFNTSSPLSLPPPTSSSQANTSSPASLPPPTKSSQINTSLPTSLSPVTTSSQINADSVTESAATNLVPAAPAPKAINLKPLQPVTINAGSNDKAPEGPGGFIVE
jgi:pilus assembly protein CpaC